MAPKKKMNVGATCSEVTAVDVAHMEKMFPGYSFRIPGKNELSGLFVEGELCIFIEQLKRGLELPIPDYLVTFFNYFKMVPAQFTPNTIYTLRGLYKFFQEWTVEWTVPNIISLLGFVHSDGFYYAQARDHKRFGLRGAPAAIHGWRVDYVFVKPKGTTAKWGINCIPSPKDSSIFKRAAMTNDIKVLFENLESKYFSLNVKDLTILRYNPKKESEEPTGKGKVGQSDEEDDDAENMEAEGSETGAIVKAEMGATPKKRRQPHRAGRPLVSMVLSDEDEEAGNQDPTGHDSTEGGAEQGGDDASPIDKQAAPIASTEPQNIRGLQIVGSEVPRGIPSGSGISRPPIQRKVRRYYGQSSLNKAQGTCTFNFNREVRMVPEQVISKVPLDLMDPLTVRSDLEYMESFSIIGLARLQSQMAVGSSVVSKFISQKFIAAGVLLESKDIELADLKKERIELKDKMAQMESVLNQVKNKAAIDLSCANDEIKKKDLQIATFAEEIDGLRSDLASSKSLLDSEKFYDKLKAEGFQKRIQELQAATRGSELSYEGAIERFKGSDEYMDLMQENGDFGFQLLKKYLIQDGIIEASCLDSFNFDTCCDRDAATLQK